MEKEDLLPQQNGSKKPPKTESGNSDKDLSSALIPVETPILQAARNSQNTNGNSGNQRAPQVEGHRMLSASNSDNKTQSCGNQDSIEARTDIGLIVRLYKRQHRDHNFGLIRTKDNCYVIDYQGDFPIPAWVKFVVPEQGKGVEKVLGIAETGWRTGWERDELKNKVIAVEGKLMLNSYYYDKTETYRYYVDEWLGKVKVGTKHYDTQPPVSCINATIYHTMKDIGIKGKWSCWWYVGSSTPIYDEQDMKTSKKVDVVDQRVNEAYRLKFRNGFENGHQNNARPPNTSGFRAEGVNLKFDGLKQKLGPDDVLGGEVAQLNTNTTQKPTPFGICNVSSDRQVIAVHNPIVAESKCTQGISATQREPRKNIDDVIYLPNPMQFNQKNGPEKNHSIQVAQENNNSMDTNNSDALSIEKKNLIKQLIARKDNGEMAIDAFIEIMKDLMEEYKKLAEEEKKIQELETTEKIEAGIERISSAKLPEPDTNVRKRDRKENCSKPGSRVISQNEESASDSNQLHKKPWDRSLVYVIIGFISILLGIAMFYEAFLLLTKTRSN